MTERGIYLAVAVLLAAAALLTLANSVALLFRAVIGTGDGDAIFDIIDRLLFVLMLVELLHSVRAYVKQGAIVAEPFFIVAIIACIRRILVITLVTSQITRPNDWTAQNASLFRASIDRAGSAGTAVAAAAYRLASELHDERLDRSHDFTNKSGVIHWEVLTPGGAPERLLDRTTLWNEVERIEVRKGAQLAREIEFFHSTRRRNQPGATAQER